MPRPAAERPDVTAAAVAEAVRHNLTSPGPVPADKQFRLIHADRIAHDLPADNGFLTWSVDGRGPGGPSVPGYVAWPGG